MGKINVKAFINSSKAILRKRSPEVLTGIGIAGMITTTVLAVKATPKALMLIEERKLDLNVEELPKIETIKTVWPCYIPSLLTGVVSTACLIGASSVNMRRNAALATAYALSESTLKDYQEKVVETIGEKKVAEVRDAIANDKIEKNPVDENAIVATERGKTLMYEPLSGRYFRSDIDIVKRIISDLNYSLVLDNYVSLNDFYCAIGLGTTDIGDMVGWNAQSAKIEVHFGTSLAANGEPCIVIDFIKPPTHDYNQWL